MLRQVALLLLAALVPGAIHAGESPRRSRFFVDDAVIRFQSLDTGPATSSRLLLQLRFGVERELDEDFRFRLRIGTGPSTTPNLAFSRLGRLFSNAEVDVDQAYLEYGPPDVDAPVARLGRFPNPHLKTELVYDDDIQFDGLGLEKEWGRLRLSLVESFLSESPGDRSLNTAPSVQAGWRFGRAEVAAGYYLLSSSTTLARAYETGDLTGFDTNRRVTTPDADGDGVDESTMPSKFRIKNLIVAGGLRLGRRPWRYTVDWSRNNGAADRDTGLVIELGSREALGRTGLQLTYFDIDQDAVPAAFTGETFLGTNRKGLSVRLERPVREFLEFGLQYVTSEGLDPWPGNAVPADATEIRFDTRIRF